jgi:hypothetical protein
MFNFSSLEAVMSQDDKDDDKPQHLEEVPGAHIAPTASSSSSPDSGVQEAGSSKYGTAPDISVQSSGADFGEESEMITKPLLAPEDDNLEESMTTLKPTNSVGDGVNDELAVPPVAPVSSSVSSGESQRLDSKHLEDLRDLNLNERERGQQQLAQ